MLDSLKQGYAHLLDINVAFFGEPGIHIVVTAKRDLPEWANWVQPIWFLAIDDAVVCSVSPACAAAVKQVTADLTNTSLLDPELLALVHPITEPQPQNDGELEWVQCELLCYTRSTPPALLSDHTIERLQPIDERSRGILRNFDGGGYVVRADDGSIAAYAGIKNKGLLQEIAVGTEPDYRRRGMGKAVVAAAVAQILHNGRVPVYWPDSVENLASYQLAYALGFQKVAEMLFCCYALPDWAGFPVNGTAA